MIFTAASFATVPAQLVSWQRDAAAARLVWDFVKAHDRYRENVLVDYDTYQAFYNYENVVVYNRLPLWLATPKKRYYPENKDQLASLIRRRLEYAVISRASIESVRELAQMAGVPFTEVAANEGYVVIRLR